MDKPDIAALLAIAITSHGDDAATVIGERIAELKAKGDDEWAAVWTKVLERIVEPS
jgi:dolichol kinase